MGKKSKKSPKKVEPKTINLLTGPQLLFLIIIFIFIFLSQNPNFVSKITPKLPKLSSQENASESASFSDSVGNLYSKAQDYFIQFAKNTKIPSKFTGLPEDMVVEEVVSSFSQEIKDLPNNQVKRIKTQICQDLIDEAASASAKQ